MLNDGASAVLGQIGPIRECAIIDTLPAADQNAALVELTTIEKLLIIRRRRDLNVQQAARRWKLSPSTLNAWEQRKRVPADETEARLKKIVKDEIALGF